MKKESRLITELRIQLAKYAHDNDYSRRYRPQLQILADALEDSGYHPAIVRMHRADWYIQYNGNRKRLTLCCNHDCRTGSRYKLRQNLFLMCNDEPLLHLHSKSKVKLLNVGYFGRKLLHHYNFPIWFFVQTKSSMMRCKGEYNEVHPLGLAALWLEKGEKYD